MPQLVRVGSLMGPRRGGGAGQTFLQSLDLVSFKTADASATRAGFVGAADTPYCSGIYYGAPPCINDNSAQEIMRSNSGQFRIYRTGTAAGGAIANGFGISGGAAGNSDTMVSSTTFKVGDDNATWTWNMDTSTATGAKRFNLWKNGVLDSSIAHFFGGSDVSHNIDWTETAWFLGCGASRVNPFSGLPGFFWVTNQYVDWGDATIYARWWDLTTNSLKDPGSDGSAYTGSAPLVYLRVLKSESGTPSTTYLVNRGTGGDFTAQATANSAPYISYNGRNVSGQLERFSKVQLAWGDSFTDGTASSAQYRAVRRLVAQASGRDDFNGGKGGYSLRSVTGDSTNFIQGYSNAWYGGASINGSIGTTSLNGPMERRPGGLPPVSSNYADVVCRMEGGYNDIHGGNWPSPSLAATLAAAQAMKDDWLQYGNGQPYYFVGPTNGGQSSLPAPAPVSISSITNVGTTATLVTATPHGMGTGMTITTTGQTPTAYRRTSVSVTVVDTTTITYTMASDPGGPATVLGTYTVASPGSTTYKGVNEEYGTPLGDVSTGAGQGGLYYQWLYGSNMLRDGLAAIFGSLYFDAHAALVQDANDATVQSDGLPLGSLQIALNAGLIGSVTSDDLNAIASDMVPPSLRSLSVISGITGSPSNTGLSYGIHLNDAGMYAHFVKEMRFKASLGIM